MKLHTLICIFFLFLLSCNSARVYEKYIKIPGELWNRYNAVKFSVDINDTIAPHNIYINIRHGSYYPRSNLFLFVTTTAPNGNYVKDTIEIILADKTGRWQGKGLGDIWDVQQLYKQNVTFPLTGEYIFEYEQAMRMENLPYILDVGLRVERVK